jgi:hypothetical protein
MFTIIENNKKDIFFIGDIHGEFNAIGHWIKENNLSNCILIFCGDFGLGFSSVQGDIIQLTKQNKVCEEFDVDCYAFRGNHDNPIYFDDKQPLIELSKIHTISDYTIIKTPEHNILCVGGAVSVDRFNRIGIYRENVASLMLRKGYTKEKAEERAKKYWWEDEQFVYSESTVDEIKKAGFNIDTVATHGAPSFCQPLTKPGSIGWSRFDIDLIGDLEKEREDFTKLLTHLKENGNNVTNWFYGHYHMHNTEVIDGTCYHALDMGRLGREKSGVGGFFDMKQLH